MAKDLCVLCWRKTEYEKDTPLKIRKDYIEGVGQLCPKCFEKICGSRRSVAGMASE